MLRRVLLTPPGFVTVRAREKVPADGIVVEGASAVNEAMHTGENVPVEKGEGGEVIGGSVNGTGALVVAVPLAAGAFAWAGLVLSPAVGAVRMSLSTVIVDQAMQVEAWRGPYPGLGRFAADP